MKKTILFSVILLAWSCNISEKTNTPKAVLVVHGGAGSLTTLQMTDSLQQAVREKISEALLAGQKHLVKGGSSVEAVQIAINILEDAPLFNAGKGAVFTQEGTHELDASIMDGQTGQAGAVAGVKTLKNPIDAALAVMNHSKHVLLSGRGAEIFAVNHGLDTVSQDYFFTQKNFERHLSGLKKADNKFGTVGAVAIDLDGNIAAGTSTGGMTNKRYGRLGDVPIIGAGTYAENGVCGISSTGHGEYFIRNVVAYDIAARMKYNQQSLEESANTVVMQKLKNIGGAGGVIGLDANKKVVMPFNTNAMPRGYINISGDPVVLIDP